MRRALTWLFDGVPLDMRSRRAVDETLTDWAYEEQEADTRAGRLLVAFRGALSLGRVASLSVLREATDFSWCRGLGRRCMWVLGVVGILAALFSAVGFSALGAWTPVVAVVLALNIVGYQLPSIVFLIFAWRPSTRESPRAGAAVAIASAALVWGLGIFPVVNQFVLDLVVTASADATGVRVGTSASPVSILDMRALLGSVCLIGATVLFASAVAQQSPLRSRWWLLGAPVAYLVGMGLLKMAYGLPLLLVFHLGDRSGGDVIARYLSLWTAAVLVLVVAIARTSRASALRSPTFRKLG